MHSWMHILSSIIKHKYTALWVTSEKSVVNIYYYYTYEQYFNSKSLHVCLDTRNLSCCSLPLLSSLFYVKKIIGKFGPSKTGPLIVQSRSPIDPVEFCFRNTKVMNYTILSLKVICKLIWNRLRGKYFFAEIFLFMKEDLVLWNFANKV